MEKDLLEYVEVNPRSKPSATVIWLHGLGADGHDFEPIVPELDLPESIPIRYVFPHAPHRPVTINGGMVMRAWFDVLAVQPDHKIDIKSFMESSSYLQKLIEKELLSGMPAKRIILAGFSQGGAIALHTGLRYEKQLAGILALSTYLPTLDQLTGQQARANSRIPIMMAHGTMDPMIPIAYGRSTYNGLSDLGYRIQWREYPMGHAVNPAEIRDISAWFLKNLSREHKKI
jgi:phospholipase/carboxylesterase